MKNRIRYFLADALVNLGIRLMSPMDLTRIRLERVMEGEAID